MSKRYWFAAIPFIIILVGSALADPPNEQVRDIPAGDEVQTKQETIPHQTKRPEYDDLNCYRTADQVDADLCAQWRAAVAAENSAAYAKTANYVAIGGAVLSFVSVFFVVAALKYARDANKIAQDIGNAQIRSYLRLEGKNPPHPNNLTHAAGCVIGVLNGGVLPAIIDRIEAQGFTAKYPLPEDHIIPDEWTTLGENIVLHPSKVAFDFSILAAQISLADRAAIVASNVRRLYYVARIPYRDAVGKGYVEQHCFSVNFGNGHPRFELANMHNTST